jgi:hypothetical protein
MRRCEKHARENSQSMNIPFVEAALERAEEAL